MEVPSADERRIYETTALELSFGVWVPSRSDELRVHYQETNLPRLLLMWARIRVFLGINASSTIELCCQRLCATNLAQVNKPRFPRFEPIAALALHS